MCGRVTLCSSCEDVAEMFQLPGLPPLEPRYNVAPAQDVLVVRRLPDAAARQGVRLRWGLIPSWAKDPTIGSRMINA
ncbi:MAG: SOS response-associated peptidase family protein, partial [Planctomycetota bacterium]|nr:SOS response-associated peptidase family protein [Planctomycetota bacterium]